MENQSPQSADTETDSKPSPQEGSAFSDIGNTVAEIWEYLRYLVLLQVDRLKFAASKAIFIALAALLGLIIVALLLASATALLLVGLAGILGNALGSFWLGAALVGTVVLLICMGGLGIAWLVYRHQTLHVLKARYARIKQDQRTRFGHDIEEAARG